MVPFISRSLLLIGLLVSSGQAATTYWVAPGGSNSNPGTQTQPWQTADHAVSAMAPGDTVNFKTGVYAGFRRINAGGGSPGLPKTLQSAPGEAAIFDNDITPEVGGINAVFYLEGPGASYFTFKNMRVTNLNLTHPGLPAPVTGGNEELQLCKDWGILGSNNGAFQFDWNGNPGNRPHHIIIDTVEMDNQIGIAISKNADDLTVVNSHIHDSGRRNLGWYGGGYGSYVSGRRHLWKNNTVHDNLNTGIRLACQNSDNPSQCPLKDSIIENNLVYNNFGRAAHYAWPSCDWDTGGYGIIIFGGTGNIIRNNVIWNNHNQDSNWGLGMGGNWGIEVFTHPSGEESTGGNQIYNNTIVDCNSPYNPNGIVMVPSQQWNDRGGGIIRNNIIFNCGPPFNIGTGSEPNAHIQDHNYTGSNPGFVNATVKDYQLAAGSNAIDAGVNLSAVSTDILLVPRPQGASTDQGAYEYGAPQILSTYSVSRNLASVAGGSAITASWTVSPGPGQAKDWIALVHAGEVGENFLLWDAAGAQAWAYTAGATTGSFTLAAPLMNGDYEFLYCVNDTYLCSARSAPFTITTGTTASGFLVRRARWHKADTPEAVNALDPDWIEGENDSIAIRPGGKVRYRVGIDYEGATPSADYYALYCTFDGTAWARLTTSCAGFYLCIGEDSAKNSGDATTPRLTLSPGYTGIPGFFVVDSLNTTLTKQPSNQQVFEMEYSLQSHPNTPLGATAQCEPRHNNGAALNQYLSSSSLVFSDGSLHIRSGRLRSGRVQ